jgi:hypothetical protein
MGKGKTQRYYDSHPEANKKRIATQKRYNKEGADKGNKIAREAVALNRKMGTYGNGDNLDASHNVNGPGKHGLRSEKFNRGHYQKKKTKNKNKLYIA